MPAVPEITARLTILGASARAAAASARRAGLSVLAGDLFGDVDLKKATLADAEGIVRRFMGRAFRRPVANETAGRFLAFLRARIEFDKLTVEDALRQTLIAVLCAPDFLMLYEAPGPLDDFAVASRLSYFLWRSMPDQTIRRD